MRKIKIISAIIVLAVFAVLQSCENNTEPKTEIVEITNAQGEVIETREVIVLEPFEMQEQTDKLVLYRTAGNERYLTPAINIFKQKYPQVEVEIVSIPWTDSYEDYLVRLNAELAAGQGPDVVLLHTSEVRDIYKMMSSRLFVDLNQFISRDGDFNMDDYVKAVLDAGVLQGRRYIMPLQYYAPVLMTTQEILDAEGINPADLSTFDGFVKVAGQYNEKYKDNSDFRELMSGVFIKSKSLFHNWQDSRRDINNLEHFFPWSGIDLIDYQTNTVAVDKAQFKKVMDLLKPLYLNKGEEDMGGRGDVLDISAFINQDWLFKIERMSFTSRFDSYNLDYVLRNAKQYGFNADNITPLYFPYPNINNGVTANVSRVAAIPAASANQINAFNFLKILLSEDIQTSHIYMYAIPVLKSAVETRVYEGLKEYASNSPWIVSNDVDIEQFYAEYEEIINERIEMMLNVDSAKMLPHAPYYEFLLDEMIPYFNGARSFDDAYTRLVNRLEIYASE